MTAEIERTVRVRRIAWEDDDYPSALRLLADPPAAVLCAGDAELLERQSLVAVVGSRNASPDRLLAARALAKDLAQRGTVIVSGLAAGTDRAAHEGALEARLPEGSSGRTVAVLGTHPDRIWPVENAGLAKRIALEGVLLTEVLSDAPVTESQRKTALRARNRLVAALGLGSVVMAAEADSGTLVEARASLRLGRPVLIWHEAAADPGARPLLEENPHDAEGNALVRIVRSAEEVDEALSPWRRVWWL